MLILSNTRSVVYLISLFALNFFIVHSAKSTNEQLYRELINLIQNKKIDKYLITDNEVNKLSLEADKNDKENLLNNKVLIKRLVPHTQQSKSLGQKNSKIKYNPLMRIHKHPNGNVNNLIVDKLLSNFYKQHDMEPYDIEAINKDRHLLSPIKFEVNKTKDDILGDIKKYIRDKDYRGIKALKYAIVNLLNRYLRARAKLRSLVYLPPGMEANFTETKNMDDLYLNIPTPNWGFNNSFWTYWTYNKPIYEDNCKGNLIQWGNICIEPPPH